MQTNKYRVDPNNYRDFLPGDNFDVKVQHINDPEKIRKMVPEAKRNAQYATVARLGRYEKDAASGKRHFVPIMESHAICCPRDTPSRKRGWSIATGRVLRRFWEGE